MSKQNSLTNLKRAAFEFYIKKLGANSLIFYMINIATVVFAIKGFTAYKNLYFSPLILLDGNISLLFTFIIFFSLGVVLLITPAYVFYPYYLMLDSIDETEIKKETRSIRRLIGFSWMIDVVILFILLKFIINLWPFFKANSFYYGDSTLIARLGFFTIIILLIYFCFKGNTFRRIVKKITVTKLELELMIILGFLSIIFMFIYDKYSIDQDFKFYDYLSLKYLILTCVISLLFQSLAYILGNLFLFLIKVFGASIKILNKLIKFSCKCFSLFKNHVTFLNLKGLKNFFKSIIPMLKNLPKMVSDFTKNFIAYICDKLKDICKNFRCLFNDQISDQNSLPKHSKDDVVNENDFSSVKILSIIVFVLLIFMSSEIIFSKDRFATYLINSKLIINNSVCKIPKDSVKFYSGKKDIKVKATVYNGLIPGTHVCEINSKNLNNSEREIFFSEYLLLSGYSDEEVYRLSLIGIQHDFVIFYKINEYSALPFLNDTNDKGKISFINDQKII